MLRFFITVLLFYIVYRIVRGVIVNYQSSQKVEGRQKVPPLDLKDSEVEDARFEDIDDESD